MATDFTQESVLGFLRCNGGRVKNSELLGHFKYFLKEDENRVQNRETFKKFVNTVAVVRHEDGVAYVVLRKKFKVPGGDIGSTHIPKRREEKPENPRSRHQERSPRKSTSRSRERRVPAETSSNLKTSSAVAVQVPTSVACERSLGILPAAGIVNNNNNNVETVNFEKTVKMSPPQTWESSPPSIIVSESNYSARTLKPLQTPPFSSESKRSSGSGQSFEQAWHKEPVDTADLEHNSVDIGNLGQAREADGCSTTFRPPSTSGHSDLKTLSPEELRLNPVVQQLEQGSQCRHERTQPAPWPLHPSLCTAPGISSSSPCIADREPAPFHKAGHQMSSSNDCLATPKREFSGRVHGETVHHRPAAAVHSPLQRRSLPLDPSYTPAAASADHRYRTSLSSAQDGLSGSDCEWPFPLTQEAWSSDDSLNQRVPMGSPSAQVREMLQRAHDAKLLSLLHRSERPLVPGYHRSTGYLDHESPCGAAAAVPGLTPEVFLRPPSRHVDQRHRSRLSRSLGAGLDQPFPEDHETARHHRLLLLSSSLSINYPLAGSPERSPSSRDVSLSGASSTASLSPGSLDRGLAHRSSLVPLEPKEHEWMVKAASGDWPVIYSLFREDSSLLSKRDFISGYTVLHWIAQHGDHRVLNTLWYGVSKAGLALDVDVRTTCGYTPLHLAAMHGHKKLIRLLVHKFKANVRLRDTSGRRAWQYLGSATTQELLQLLGAPPQKKKAAGGSSHPRADKLTERPATISATVKRHSSLAALFKHKSLGRVMGHTEMHV